MPSREDAERTEMLERATVAVIRQHDEELKAYLAGEVPANQWRPEKYAEAALAAALHWKQQDQREGEN